jgi:hypothetical protein
LERAPEEATDETETGDGGDGSDTVAPDSDGAKGGGGGTSTPPGGRPSEGAW